MIEIIGLREYDDTGKKAQAFFDEGWCAPTVRDLFASVPKYLGQIPDDERWNIYYTVAECDEKAPRPRVFKQTNAVAFDIDGVGEDAEPSKYLDILRRILQIPDGESVGFVSSGHGFHVLVGLDWYVTELQWFKDMKPHYDQICYKIDAELRKFELKGSADRSIFDPARILRMPGTRNVKPDKPEVMCQVLCNMISPLSWDMKKVSGLGEIASPDSAMNEKVWYKIKEHVDKLGVLSGCEFIKYCKEHVASLPEPLWYAMVGIVARLADGPALVHAFSKDHPGYSFKETDEKIAHALAASLPMKCRTIDKLWHKCNTCPHFEKISCPMEIVSEDFIATSRTGFRSITFVDGKPTKGKPNYEDLRKFFERENAYKSAGGGVFTWDGHKWKTNEMNALKEYAYYKFERDANENVRKEFINLLVSTNVVKPSWFSEQSYGKINFKNGTLLLDSNEFVTHAPEFGMTYVLPYDYEPDAECRQFEKFLLEVMCDNAILVDFLTEYLGYCVSGDSCWAHKAMFLYGAGRNGKSLLMKVMKTLVGKDNWSSIMLDELNDPNCRSMLVNKLFNIGEETPDEGMLDSSAFKVLVAGEEMTAKNLYSDKFVFSNRAKLLFAGNDLPSIKNLGDSILERLMILPFNAKFTPELGNQDPFLYEKLVTELPGIMNLLIKSYKRLKDRGRFEIPIETKNVQEELRLGNDSAYAFMRDKVVVKNASDDCYIEKTAFFESYKSYCAEMGVRAVASNKFYMRVRRIVPDYDTRENRPNGLGSRPRVIQGFEWRERIEGGF